MAVSIALILLLGLGADHLFRRLRLPGLLGMLLVGVVCGPYALDLIQPELLRVSADLRMVALIIILLRAGLGLRRDTLNRVGGTALLMSCVPSLLEMVAVILLAPPLLGISHLEAAILAAVLAAVSPAVVVPAMLAFIQERVGVAKGIPTLILSAAAVDNVFVIVIATIFLGMHAGGGGIAWFDFLQVPEAILTGIGIGVLAGFALYFAFRRYRPRATKMAIAMVALSILLTWLEATLKPWLPMSALLGVMTIGFILLEKNEGQAHAVAGKLAKAWVFAEILLFVLVGAQVNIHVAWDAGLVGLLLIVVALIGRSVGVALSVMGSDLNARERLFCTVAYVPKATVQAAIGSVPLEAGVASGDLILAMAVLAIVLTAPLGAIGIQACRGWLTREETDAP